MKKNLFYEVYSFNGMSPSGTITHQIFQFLGDAQRYAISNIQRNLFIDEWVVYADGTKICRNIF